MAFPKKWRRAARPSPQPSTPLQAEQPSVKPLNAAELLAAERAKIAAAHEKAKVKSEREATLATKNLQTFREQLEATVAQLLDLIESNEVPPGKIGNAAGWRFTNVLQETSPKVTPPKSQRPPTAASTGRREMTVPPPRPPDIDLLIYPAPAADLVWANDDFSIIEERPLKLEKIRFDLIKQNCVRQIAELLESGAS